MNKDCQIIVVDDVLANCLLLKKYLETEGYNNVSHYLSAKEALSEITHNTSLVLMDIMMPEMDGVEAVVQIRKKYSRQQLPIIMVTAANQSTYLEQSFLSGANDFIGKPVERIEFVARIRAAIDLKQQYDKQVEYERILQKLIEKQQLQKMQIESELEFAKQIQKNLLPAAISNTEINMHGRLLPSNRLSGDFYYWHRISKHKYGVIIIDIMGHDISASLVAMSIRSLLPGIIANVQEPKAVMLDLNKHMIALYQERQDVFNAINYYFTAIYVAVDLEKDKIEYINSGHPLGLLFTSDASIHLLDKGSPPIGSFPHIPIEVGELPFKKGDRLILYTDGILDLLENNHVAHIKYFSQILTKHRQQPIELLVNNTVNDARKNTLVINDDITLLAIERK